MNWLKKNLPWVWKARWFIVGSLAFLAVWALSTWANLTHSTGPENYHSIAWTYITLAIGITSLLYPLALTIRDSLTTRLFVAFDKLRATKKHPIDFGDKDIQSFMTYSYKPLQRFRTVLFDIQLPILAVFSLLSVVRTLFCLLQLGPLPVTQQMVEPQFYMFAYVVWLIWVSAGILILRPYYAIEKAETDILGLPNFEQSFAQELADKSDAEVGRDPKDQAQSI
jgi:hypothetical protein